MRRIQIIFSEIMFIECTEFCTFFEKLCISNVQNYINSLKNNVR